MLETLKINHQSKKKEAFYCSDVGKYGLDIFLSLKNVPKTNPAKWNETLKWGAGKGVEESMLTVLKDSGVVDPEYKQEEHGRVDMVREGVVFHGYIDAKAIENYPIEIKSINNKNAWDIQKYKNNHPRENYIGQLSTYIDFMGAEKGALFVASIDGLDNFWFWAEKQNEGIYKCGDVTFDLGSEYKRLAHIWELAQAHDTPPDELLWEKRYKIPVNEIDWTKVSAADISKARNGKKVIGSWEIQYSDYKDLIVEMQGETLGYTPEELELIKQKTEGYTNWPKN